MIIFKTLLSRLLTLALGLALMSGCATTGLEDDDIERESDLPWNTPQSWEGAPSIPGLGSGGGGY